MYAKWSASLLFDVFGKRGKGQVNVELPLRFCNLCKRTHDALDLMAFAGIGNINLYFAAKNVTANLLKAQAIYTPFIGDEHDESDAASAEGSQN